MIDIYSTRAQLAAIDQLPPEYNFMYDTFVSEGEAVEEEKAIFDVRKNGRPMAPIVHYGTGGVVMERDGFETREINFCTIAPERVIRAELVQKRMFGEEVLGALSPEQREKKIMAADLLDMNQAITRRKAWMVRQILLTGKLEVFEYTNEGRSKNVTAVADFQHTQKITPETPWNQTGAKINADMARAFDKVYDAGGMVDVIVMAPDVAAAMLSNSDYLKQLDTKNMNIGEINARYVGQGMRYLGRNLDGVDMYSCAGKFTDDAGDVQSILPGGTLIAGSKGMLKSVYGPVSQIEDAGMNARHKHYVKKLVPLRYASVTGNALMHRLTSRPMIMPGNVDGWAVMNVL